MKANGVLATLVIVMLCASVLPAKAQDLGSSQLSEATVFFNQLIENTDNPYIARLAQESLNKLNRNQSQLKFQPATSMGKRQVEVPLLSRVNNSLAVPVVLNKRVMGTFIVDTGATYTVITPAMAQRLGVRTTADTPQVTILTANGPVKAPKVIVDKIALGGVEVSNVPVIVHNLGHDTLLAGLLGMSFFKDMDLTIKQNKLILSISYAN